MIANTPPNPQLSPFGYVAGGAGNALEANENLQKGSVPPYLEPVLDLRDSERYKKYQRMAAGYIVREGVGLLTPHCLCALYDGNATDAYTI